MNKTYYPQASLVGFGSALADKLGIEVEYTTGSPRTNGTTIFLPKISGAITEDEFLALCGTAVHEAAHVYFGSCSQHRHYIDFGGPNGGTGTEELRAACMNAVLDVADETRMEWVLNPTARRLLQKGNIKADCDIMQRGLDGSDPVWEILAAAILGARLERASSVAVMATSRHGPNWQLTRRVCRVLKGIRALKAPSKHKRTGAQWSRLQVAADELVELLKHLPPPAKPPGFGQVGSDAEATAGGGGCPCPAGASMAGYAAGDSIAKSGEPDQGGSSASGNGSGNGGNGNPHAMNESLYSDLAPALSEPVRLMAEYEEADGPTAGYTTGARLGKRLDRAYTDGRVFVRREGEGEKLSMAILLDVSGSMYSNYLIADALAVAQAFADAVRPVAENMALSEFNDYPRKKERFDGRGGQGGTNAAAALRWASQWLDGLGGRRVCVIITDGQAPAEAESAAMVRAGVRLIGIAYRTNPGELAENMPGAEVIGAQTPAELASQLAEVAGAIAH